ncbi:hypothetical protein CHS0354_004399 [Potamilus streckersoni]|uniref:TIR domain-containing protein n=1 Tax=Potamilus streckersoni TaxID=2493646 RepID=A0AAE0W4W3_9BIVA|nr:hypothetical protein CHS0354_004399 [Potamilus streckersoni]
MSQKDKQYTQKEKEQFLGQYKIFMPQNLACEEHYDMIIIHPTEADNDKEKVYECLDELKKLEYKDKTPIKVTILENFALHIGSMLERVDLAVRYCSVILIYLTENYSNNEYEQKFFTETALMDAIKNKRSSVVPLYAKELNKKTLPSYLLSLVEMNCNDEYFKTKLINLATKFHQDRKKREEDLHCRRLDWAVEYHEKH